MDNDAFAVSWIEAVSAWTAAARAVSAAFKLTNAGEKAAALEELAAIAKISPDEAALALTQFFSEAHVQGGMVDLGMATTREPSSRFELRIGNRTSFTDGCAPDQFWIPLFIDQPVEIRATAQPIRVVVSASGVEDVEPAETMVGLISPAEVKAVTRAEDFDRKVCIYQTFLTSHNDAEAWKQQHPGGKVMPAREFFELWREILKPIAGDLMTMVNQPKTKVT